MVLQSCYVVFFSDVEVFSVLSGLCVVLKDGFALMALSVLLFPEKAFPRSSAVFFCGVSSAPMLDLSVMLLFVMLLFVALRV